MKKKQLSHFLNRKWLKILLEMKLIFFLTMVFSVGASAGVYSQHQRVSIQFNDASILEVLTEIKNQTDLSFIYSEEKIQDLDRIDLVTTDETVENVLHTIFDKSNLECKFQDNVIMVVDKQPKPILKIEEEKRSIKGKVTDKEGVPLPGVSVVIKGSSIGVATNIEGEYSLELENENVVLVFSFVGMKSQEIHVRNKEFYNIILEPDSEGLEEVMVVAYGTTTKNAFTGSAVSVSSEDLQRNISASPITALQGQAAGVSISASSGQPGAGYSVNIRGTGSINNNTQPLYVVDGLAMSTGGISSTLTSSDVLSSLDPDDIESMTILKDAAATSLYGSRAANGVVVITTKSGKDGKTKITIDLKQGYSDWAVKDEVETYALGDEYTQYSMMALENYYLEKEDYLAHWDSGQKELVPQQEITPEIREEARLYAFRYLNDKAKVVHPDDNLDGEFDYDFIEDFDDLSPEEQALNMPLLEKYLTHVRKDNWAKKMFKKGKTTKASISAKGGTKSTKFYTSLGYYYQDGMVDKSNYKRLNARLNLEHRFNEKLKFRFGQSISHSIQNGVKSGNGSYANPMYALNKMNPTMPIKYSNGEYNISPGFKTKTPNPFINVDLQTRRYWTTLSKSNAKIKYQFADFLFFETTNGVELLFTKEKQSTHPEHNDGLKYNGKVNLYNQRRFTINSSNILNFRKEIKDHDFGFLLGFELEDYIREKNSVEGKNFANGDKLYIGNAAIVDDGDEYEYNKRLLSYLSKVDYNYDNKYYISGSYRRDGSSKLAQGNRWGDFWSASGSWVFSKEKFVDFDWLNFGKLKVSYGTNGNLPNSYYDALDLYRIDASYNGNPATILDQLENVTLSWEKSRTLNLGFEFKFLKKYNFDVEVYRKKTTKLIHDSQISFVTGFDEITENRGELLNEGIEFTFDAELIKTDNFRWKVNLNGTHYRTKITDIAKEFIDPSTRQIYRKGEKLYSFYLREWAGVDAQTGMPTWYTNTHNEKGNIVNHDKTFSTSGKADDDGNYYQQMAPAEKIIAGDPYPILSGGFTTDFKYKSFSLEALFTYKIGGDIYDSRMSYFDGKSVGAYSTYKDALKSVWMKPGDHAKNPRVIYKYPDDGNGSSSRMLKDGSFLRLKSVKFAYNLPKNWIRSVGIERCQFYVNADNLFTWSKVKNIDPEVTRNGHIRDKYYFPKLKTATVGVSLSF